MDEFHYYADRDRGVAWQVPLLTLPQARFLLMSATLGDDAFFEEAITRLNGRPTVTVKSGDRPVPLEYAYSEIPLAQTVEKLVDEGKAPVYVVHFTQADAASSAQDFTSLKICTRKEEKAEIAARDRRLPLHQPVRRGHQANGCGTGIGLHHAGLLPKYRVLVEQLAQAGLLKVICGTDTLGVGHQRAHPHGALHAPVQVRRRRRRRSSPRATSTRSPGARAARASTTAGFVVAQAPEHVIENLRLEEKAARDGKKVVKRKPPEHNFVNWDLQHIQAPDRRAARAAGVALPGDPRDAAERAEPARRRLPRDAAAHPRQPRDRSARSKAHRRARLAALPRPGRARHRRDHAADRGRRAACA